jgi:DNA-binding protein YbaB
MEKQEQPTLSDEELAKAKQEIEEVLQKYKAVLIPITIHHGDKTFSRIDIAPSTINSDNS